MKLKDLMKGINVYACTPGYQDIEVSGIAVDHRKVKKGGVINGNESSANKDENSFSCFY